MIDTPMIEGLMEVIVPQLCDYVDSALTKATAPLLARLAELEGRPIEKGEPGQDGKSVTLDDVRPLIEEAVSALPKPEDGKSVTLQDVRPVLEELVAAIPVPQDGKSVDLEEIEAMVASAVTVIPPPKDGKDADPVEVAALISAEVERQVAALPTPKDGKSVTLDDVRPLIEEAVAKIPVPKDGVGLAGAVIDRSGALVVTLTDGAQRELGPVVGKDGEPGKPGADGLGFEHMEEEVEDGGRVVIRRYRRGDEVKEFRHTTATVIDRGVWKEGSYLRGDSVSRGGSTWIAQKDTTTKPDTPDSDWRLSTKRGNDGKDFRPDTPRTPPGVKFK